MDLDPFADPFDPRSWQPDDHEHRIYASNDPDFYVIVDQEDYSFLAQFSWSIHTYSNGKDRRKKFYLRRSISDFYDSDGERYQHPLTGQIVRNRRRVQRNLFLHFVVMLRKGDIPPDKHHHIVDHQDRNTRNCRRSNLWWQTPSHNTKNQHRHVNRKPRKNVPARRSHRSRRRPSRL